MSLTSLMQDKESWLSNWILSEMPASMISYHVRTTNKVLSTKNRIADYDSDPTLMGTAFDYAFRYMISKNFRLTSLVAYRGAKIFGSSNEVDALRTLIDMTNKDNSRIAETSIILSWYEQLFRSGISHPQYESVKGFAQPETPDAILESLRSAVRQHEIDDINNLLESAKRIFSDEIMEIDYRQLTWYPNPTFTGSEFVGGADADWIIGDTLYDAKCSWKRQPMTTDMLHQVMLYQLLEGRDNNQSSIKSVAIYFPRHEHVAEFSLADLWGDKEIWDIKCRSFWGTLDRNVIYKLPY